MSGSHIGSPQHVGSGHLGTRGQFNHSGAGHLSGGHFTGVGSHAGSHALSGHNFAAASQHGGINAGHHHHHHNFFFYPFAFGALYSAYPYYYYGGYPYAYGYGGGDPCDPYSPYYDPAYCDWLYSQGYYGNGSLYQSVPSGPPPQGNDYPQQQQDDPSKDGTSSTANPSSTVVLQTLVNQSEFAEDVDLDEAPAEYTAAIPAPLVAATSAPEALPQQVARSK
jgi:hypothetical protein